MDKYTIDDLIIDDPASATGKSGQKPKRKFTTIIALIAIIVVSGVFLSKTKMGSSVGVNSTEEIKAEGDNINELLEPKQEKSAATEQEAKKASDDLSIAITELDSLTIPKTEPIKDEIVTAKTDALIDQKQEALVPEESVEKTADELSIAGTETKAPEPTTSEPTSDVIAVAETNASTDQKQDVSIPEGGESKKIADTLSTTDTDSGAEKLSETEHKTNETEKQESVKISDVLSTTDTAEATVEKSKTESTVNLSNEPETGTLKNNTSKVVDSQDKPKQETKSKTTKTPDTKKEDIALKKRKEKEKIASEKKKKEKEKREKIASEKKKVKSKPKTKSKQGGFFSTFSKNSRYYILVGSNPSSRFMSKIKNSRLHYVIRKSGGKRSVFVGPYRSSGDAKRSISKVQKATGVKGVVVKAK